ANAAIAGTAGNGLDVTGATAQITNAAGISGTIGIAAASSTSTTIDNSGTITGTGGTAVRFTAGSGNVLAMTGPGATLSGAAIGNGSDILRLAGTGANTIDIGQVVSGFSTFQK